MKAPYVAGDTVYVVGRVIKGRKPSVAGYTFKAYSLEYPGFVTCEFVFDATQKVHTILLRLDALYPNKTQAERAAQIAQSTQDKKKKRAKRVIHTFWGKDASNYAFGTSGAKTVKYA